MDEKEAVTRVRNSFKAKKSHADVLRGFQSRGYKLEYAEKIIEKATRPKRLIKAFLISLVVLLSIFIASYFSIFNSSEKNQIENPYKSITANSIYSDVESKPATSDSYFSEEEQDSAHEQVIITPEYISYLLNELGAWNLRRNPLTLEPPILNFVVGEQTFNSRVDSGEIITNEGLSENADLKFTTSKEILFEAISSQDPKSVFKESVISGGSQYEINAGETELLAKGYLGLYNSLV